MNIFEFKDSLIVMNDIRSIIVEHLSEEFERISLKDDYHRPWIIKIIFSNESMFITKFRNEASARETYNRLKAELEEMNNEK